jgi:nitrite reductase/ring-hydroxylating ferredoxin subunit
MNSKYLNENTVKDVLAVDRETSTEISDERDVREAVASHQHEFPYDRDEESQVTRREFCNFLFLTSSTLFLGAAGFAGKYAYDSQFTPVYTAAKIEGAKDLQPGNALNFTFPNENDTSILIRSLSGEYHAYGQKCTHLTCPVYYEKKNDRIECPCHEGGFDVSTGNVLYGPPPRPLDKVEIEVRPDGEVWAIGRRAGGEEHHG